jgi:molybdenum cofactor guanylyltransferase
VRDLPAPARPFVASRARDGVSDPRPHAGAVLTGGAGTRMGADKALLVVGGRPMAVRVVEALAASGADEVVCVGGDARALAALGLRVVPDEVPGAGPLAAVATALAALPERSVLVVACDLVAPDPDAMAATVRALQGSGADVAAPVLDGTPQWTHAAWAPSALPVLRAALAAGERAIHRAARHLAVCTVAGLDPTALADADHPEDLPTDARRPR